MRKYANKYYHLRDCEIGEWQGLVRGNKYNKRITSIIYDIEDIMSEFPMVERSRTGTAFVVYIVHLADFLFHKINFPEKKSRRVRAIKNKLKLPRQSFNGKKWTQDRYSHINDMLELLRFPLREEGENTVDIGPFVLKNPINLSTEKVEEMVDACTRSLTYCTNSLAPNFNQALYGEVVLVEKLERASWYAWYNSVKDNITMKYMNREKEEFMKTFIHEIGHRYYKKVLCKSKKALWRIYDRECHLGSSVYLDDFIGKDIGLYARKKRTRTSIGPNPNRGVPVVISRLTHKGVVLAWQDGSELEGWYRKKYLKRHIKARRGLFPTNYAGTDVEEHFCEAIAYKALGKLHPKALEAFNSIIVDGNAYVPKMSNFIEMYTPPEEDVPTQVESTLPTKQQMIQTSESLASRLGLLFKKGRKYGQFIYTNEAVGSTHAYMFIDYATGNLFMPKAKSKPNLNVNLSNISDDNLDVCVGPERMSSLKPRWRTMNVITEPTRQAPTTETSDQTPEPNIPTTPEGNTEAIIEASRKLASALGMSIKVLKRVIIFLYQNEETNSTHTYLVIDKTNGYAHPPKHKVLAKVRISLGSVFEPNILTKVNIEAMERIQPAWRTKYKHPKRIK